MAITITSQMTDVSLNPGSPTSIGTGNAAASETAINLEGTNCAAIGHSGATGPTSPTAISQYRGMYTTVTSFTRTDMHLHIWVRDLYPVRDVNVGGVSAYIYGTSEAIYYATGLDKNYNGGWFHYVLNLDAGDRPAASLGTAPSSNITRVGYCGNISVSKGEDFLQNCYLDAIRRGTGGQGITMRGGTSGTPETFAGCASADSSSYGIFRDIGGAFFIEGPITWGLAANDTYITESLQTLNFTNFTCNNGTGGNTVVSSVASDYYRVTLADGTTSVTDIDFTDVTFKGVSRSTPFRFTSNLGTGDTYNSTRTTYIFGEDITYNAQVTSDSDVFVECQTVIAGGITLTSPTFNNCDAVTLNATNDAISGGSTSLHNTATSNAFVTTDDLDKITDHTFDNTGGNGWAIDVGTITATRSDTCDGNTFTGYSTTVNGDKAIRVSVNSGQTYTINATNGSNIASNLVYNAGTGTVVVNNTVTVKLTVTDSNGTAIQNARVLMEAASGGDLTEGTDILTGLTNASGIVQDTGFNYTNPQPVKGWVRKSTGSPYYKEGAITGTIQSTGYDNTVQLVLDE